MGFEHTDASTEAQEGKVNIYNVVLSYVVEMNEHRSVLFTSVQMTGGTPSSFKEFITAFYKLFTFTQSMLPEELREEITDYFEKDPRKNDSRGKQGTKLSLKMQRELENQRMITLYEETIVPPFVEITDEDNTVDDLIKKTILNPVTKTKYTIGKINRKPGEVKSLWKKKGVN
jgi:hypothetical protein